MNDGNCIFRLSVLGILSLTIKIQAEKGDGESVKVVICTQQHFIWTPRLLSIHSCHRLRGPLACAACPARGLPTRKSV